MCLEIKCYLCIEFHDYSVNLIYKNADYIIIVIAFHGKLRIEGADGTVGFYSSDS